MPYLHKWSPALVRTLPHTRLGTGPTPVRPLPSLGQSGCEIWLKDESGFGDGGWGGNKVRKLEWLLPDVKRRGRKTILTFGGLGTNWGLATALYGREQGIHTALGLIDQPRDQHVEEQLKRLEASGASLHFTHTKNRTIALAPWLILRHSSGLRPPYILPSGGSSPLGALSYVETAFEIAAQVESGELPEPGHAVVPTGSGGTAAGLALGFALAGLGTRVVGVIVTEHLRLDDEAIGKLAGKSAALLRQRGAAFPEPDLNFEMTEEWLGETYGAPTPESEAAIERARADGLELDPVYTAKAMAALIAKSAAGDFEGGPVLFINTNGPR
ncbi:MAG TPA: pyridoxal-phosphate dependent enzyme [Solirubrobacterales bacterium]|nr:pyridoxal-phosphate dependent enzyme [Solirubrobacterales bacterium]HMW45399.1 pyridoxal-phosphate dependent enzyme [Solirubrobacterales bacterium]HMX70515.1 pyridoxal-phosphate dependent enzyme [Solirubrobacterales bacterium]HNC06371.1 pyridoxal-phosphate dependent enzyme [Solirubrobacterales bacterium]HNH87040.1 pyridoxal-phosphate dependent enzyme [Solirubrobacterales bacterium]